MKKIFLAIVIFTSVSDLSGQVIYIDDLINKIGFATPDVKRQKIAFVVNGTSNLIDAKKTDSSCLSSNIIFFDNDSLFVEHLKNSQTCLLLKIIPIDKQEDTLKVEIHLYRVKYESYTNSLGSLVIRFREGTAILVLNKSKSVWEYKKELIQKVKLK